MLQMQMICNKLLKCGSALCPQASGKNKQSRGKRSGFEAKDRLVIQSAAIPIGGHLIKDSEHPFFRPLWRRVVVVAVCLVWAVFEFAVGEPLWGVIMMGFAGYAIWQLFISYAPPPVEGQSDE